MSLLIVEDDEPFVALMLHSLKPKAYRVAHTINEAFALIDQEAPDVILLDLSLPGSRVDDTIGQISELKRRSKDATIIVITGYPDLKRLQDAATAKGARTVLSKDNGLFGRLPDEIIKWANTEKPTSNPIVREIEDTVKRIVAPEQVE